jgi:hypothetical protein
LGGLFDVASEGLPRPRRVLLIEGTFSCAALVCI